MARSRIAKHIQNLKKLLSREKETKHMFSNAASASDFRHCFYLLV